MLSVHTPCFNEANYLEDFVRSMAQQELRPLKLTLHDNDSNDASPEVFTTACKEYGMNSEVVQHTENIGGIRNLRSILSYAANSSEIFVLCANHETYHPNYLSTLWEKSQCDANRAITYSNCDFVDQNTGEKLLIEAPDLDTGGLDKVEGFTKVLTNYTYANALWSCYSSKNVKWAPPFPFNRGGDHAFVAGLALTGEICFVNRKLYIRQRDQNRTLLDLARGESATNDNSIVNLTASYYWLNFWTCHYDVIKDSFITERERRECIRILTEVCILKSNGSIYKEIDIALSAKPAPIHCVSTAAFLRTSILKRS